MRIRRLDDARRACFDFTRPPALPPPAPCGDALLEELLEVEPAPPPPPATLGRVGPYELLVELASGGMATVYLARATDKREGPPLVAVKRPHRHLATDKMFLTMLVDEARLASAIHHPNVVKVRELGFEGGVPFIVMDYVEGASLAELRRELTDLSRCVDVKVALRIMLDSLGGLHSAHELRDETGKHLGIVHRDVSPHNDLIGCDGRAHITDFGIAKAEDRVQVTRTHEVKGKLAYLAPERIDKRRICTVQSDVFSMAVVLWECFAGRRLFRGEAAAETLQEVMSGVIPTLRQIGAQIPASIDDVVARALSRDLDTRYATAAEFASALERAAGPENIGTHADVARLMEAIFAHRMAQRHELVRSVLGDEALERLLSQSGIPLRERSSEEPEAPRAALLAQLAPPAPSGRYSFSHVSRGLDRFRPKKRSAWLAVGATAGVVAGVAITAAVMSRGREAPPIIVRTSPSDVPTSPAPATVLSVRKVVVPLPFVATRVTFDDSVRELIPATDIAAFDVAAESGTEHRVTATALDGTRAEAIVHENDGVARPDASGYTTVVPQAAQPIDVDPKGGAPLPMGRMKNGFTKLK